MKVQVIQGKYGLNDRRYVPGDVIEVPKDQEAFFKVEILRKKCALVGEYVQPTKAETITEAADRVKKEKGIIDPMTPKKKKGKK